MKQKLVPSAWLDKEGRRLDCGPYLSGAMEAKVPLERLPVPRADLCSLTHGREGRVYSRPQFARNYVSDPDLGVPYPEGQHRAVFHNNGRTSRSAAMEVRIFSPQNSFSARIRAW